MRSLATGARADARASAGHPAHLEALAPGQRAAQERYELRIGAVLREHLQSGRGDVVVRVACGLFLELVDQELELFLADFTDVRIAGLVIKLDHGLLPLAMVELVIENAGTPGCNGRIVGSNDGVRYGAVVYCEGSTQFPSSRKDERGGRH